MLAIARTCSISDRRRSSCMTKLSTPKAGALIALLGLDRVVAPGEGASQFEGKVSGAWRLDRKPMTDVGLLIYVMVDSVDTTVEKILQAGGTIVQPIGADAPEITARFADPAGNILGLYQNRP